MASLSRAFHSRNTSSSSIISQKVSYRNGSSANNAYDDVFEARRKFEAPKASSRVQDYDEIFGGSGGPRDSSIPFIDLSALEETNVSTDVRSSMKDYSNIFGDFRDEGVSLYEDMLAGPTRDRKFSEETRTLSPPKGSKSLNDPNKRHREFPHEASPSFSGVKQFTMSYNRSDQRSNNGSNGTTTHTAQLRAVPGFTCFIDTNTPPQKTDCSKSVPSVAVDDYLDMNFSGGTIDNASHLTKKQKDEDIVKPINGVSPPSNLPSRVINNKGASKRPKTISNLEVPKSGDSSPRFSDEELDVNSAAAAAIATLRKAIEIAQESIRIAKESMERKNGFRGLKKPSSRTNEKNTNRISERKDAVTMHDLVGKERQNVTRSGKVAPEFHDNVKLFIGREGVKEANSKREPGQERKAKRPDSKQEISDKHGTASLPLEEAGIYKKRSAETAEKNPEDNVKLFIGREGVEEANNKMKSDQDCKTKRPSKQEISDRHGTTSIPLEEAGIYKIRSLETAKEKSEGKLKNVTEQTRAGNDVENKLKASQEKATAQNFDGEHREKKPEVFMTKELEEHWKPQVTQEVVQEQVKDEKTAVAQDAEKTEEKQKAFYEQERCEKNEKVLNDDYEKKECTKMLENNFEREEIEKRQEACITLNLRSELKQGLEAESNMEKENDSNNGDDNEKTLYQVEVRIDEKREGDTHHEKESKKFVEETYERDASESSSETHDEVNEEILEVTKFCEYKEEKKEKEPSAVKKSYEPEMKETYVDIENKMENATKAFLFYGNRANSGFPDISFGQKQMVVKGNAFESATNLKSNEFEHTSEETQSEFKEEDGINLEKACEGTQWGNTGLKIEASQLPDVFTGENKVMYIDGEIGSDQDTEKNDDNVDKTYGSVEKEVEEADIAFDEEETETSFEMDQTQSTEKNEETSNKTKETVERESKKEKEHLRTLDEENTREKEREKERLVVERAIREVRERAFAEARERAERAAVERATAEARQRVIEGIKSSAEKASIRAKLRAERALVERATTEARERAREKAALSQKVTTSKPQVQSSSGNSGARSTNDSQRVEITNSESALRDKAILEKNQRIAERGAKALAEMNQRDLKAQKDQAEKDRIMESVDADVKRWSSGKEGNLRALLSTLQYVLGPNSGWQPVSLTDIVTSIAVRKAYRKATLFLHPDKLQQRGASIRQKYICEKVFDLLKAAWNRFSAEEGR